MFFHGRDENLLTLIEVMVVLHLKGEEGLSHAVVEGEE